MLFTDIVALLPGIHVLLPGFLLLCPVLGLADILGQSREDTCQLAAIIGPDAAGVLEQAPVAAVEVLHCLLHGPVQEASLGTQNLVGGVRGTDQRVAAPSSSNSHARPQTRTINPTTSITAVCSDRRFMSSPSNSTHSCLHCWNQLFPTPRLSFGGRRTGRGLFGLTGICWDPRSSAVKN